MLMGTVLVLGFGLVGGRASKPDTPIAAEPVRIVVPASVGAAAYAAGELQTFLEKVSGRRLPIVAEERAGKGPAFYVGLTQRAIDAGLWAKARKLGADGVVIKTIGDDVVLVGGGDRGHLYSVYVLLERYLGCRFLARGCTLTPRRVGLKLPRIDYAYASPFIYREELYHDAADWAFAARQRLNGSNMNQCISLPSLPASEKVKGILIFPFVHTAAALVPASKYFATHPEYYSLVGGKRTPDTISGQLCFTNPDVLRISTAQVLAWLKSQPGTFTVDVSQNDAWPGRGGACECASCRAVVTEEGAEHGPILRFVNAIADVVAKECPGTYVDTLAYQYSVAAPKITKPRDNVIIRLCHYACYFHGIEGETLGAEYLQAVNDWRKVAKNVWVWHYGTNFWHYLAPNPNLAALAKDIKFYAQRGINGVMVQGNIQSSGGELAEFRQYLVSQLLWDPTRDPMAIRKEFCEGYYGPASADVLEFLALMDAFGRDTKRHIPMNGWRPEEVTPPEFVSKGLVVLKRAYERAGSDAIRNRIEKLMLPLWYMQLSWPDRYGLSKDQGKALVARANKLMRANDITTIAEGPPNADAFIRDREAFFGVAGG